MSKLVIGLLLSALSIFIPNNSMVEFQDLKQALNDAIKLTENGEFAKQHSILIYKDEELVVERYWSGNDGWRGNRNFDADSLHDLRSCSKSVVGLLVGIAIDENLIPADLNTKAYKFFPDEAIGRSDLESKEHQSITLENLLNMTDGFDWQQHETKIHVNNESEMESSRDSVEYVWSQPLVRQPGKDFNYNSGATVLLAGVIKRVSGRSIEEYASEKLFKPMRIKNWEWMKTNDKEPGAHFGLRLTPARHGEDWPFDSAEWKMER